MSRIAYTIKQAFSQMGRNKGMYFTTIMAITAMMLILGLFFVAFVNVNLFTETIEDDYNVVQVYAVEENDDAANQLLQNNLASLSGVSNVEYVTKEQAMLTLKERWGNNAYLLDSLRDNPLPNSFMVYVDSKDSAGLVAQSARTMVGVDDIVYYQDTIDKLAKVSDFIKIGSIVCMIFLIVVSIIIVANTIKLTVHNRAKEIGIMKYLGATDAFVRAPFVVNGIVIGIISSAVSTGLIYIIYKKVIDIVGADVTRMLSVSVVPAESLIWNLLLIFACLGIGIGTIGSVISIRRFLDK